jgi:capsular polysaccharide biosynthesis protein
MLLVFNDSENKLNRNIVAMLAGITIKMLRQLLDKGIESELSIEDAIKFLGELLVGNGVREG